MNHQDHVNLIRKGIPSRGGTWADLGSGRGAFTLALADLLDRGAQVYSVDKNRQALAHQERVINRRFPQLKVHYIVGDFTEELNLPSMDGIVMANALHFVRDKEPVLTKLRKLLIPEGRFILVEYNTDRGNIWVPHPVSYHSWEKLSSRVGFTNTRKIAARPSSFLGEIYAAISRLPRQVHPDNPLEP
jgi:ubiquinone/menaquinone biosynthesis C-methylase UbiE